MPIKNTQRSAAVIWLLIGVFGLLMIFMPSMFDIDIMDGGAALIFLGIFAAITGVIVSIMFFKRARVVDDAFSDTSFLIHWTYEKDTWDKYAEKEFQFRKSGNRALFMLVGGMCLAAGIIFVIIDPDAGRYVLLVMLGVIVILGITAILTAVMPYNRNKKRVGEVYIFNNGLYINGQTHIWKGFAARLDKVIHDSRNNLLKFTYSAITRVGRQHYTVLVPIPPGQENTAVGIVSHFM